MKKATLVLLAVLVAGCSPQTFTSNEVSPFAWQAANQLCSNQGGLDQLTATNSWTQNATGGKDYTYLHISVRCANGVNASRGFDLRGAK